MQVCCPPSSCGMQKAKLARTGLLSQSKQIPNDGSSRWSNRPAAHRSFPFLFQPTYTSPGSTVPIEMLPKQQSPHPNFLPKGTVPIQLQSRSVTVDSPNQVQLEKSCRPKPESGRHAQALRPMRGDFSEPLTVTAPLTPRPSASAFCAAAAATVRAFMACSFL